jgi:hypothetical protein
MQATIKFHCQFCGAKISAKESLVGQSRPCPNCSSRVTVPTWLPAATPPAEANHAIAPLTPKPRDQAHGFGLSMAPPQDDLGLVPIEMRMPGKLGGIKAQVDKPTSNILTSAFAGGILVVIGAFLVAMLGGKARVS